MKKIKAEKKQNCVGNWKPIYRMPTHDHRLRNAKYIINTIFHQSVVCSNLYLKPLVYSDDRLTSSVLRKVTSSSFSVCSVLSSLEISFISSVRRLILLSLLTNSILLYSISASSWRTLSTSFSFSWTTRRRSEPSSAAWRLSRPT